MARLQILELPEGSGDDRPPFVLVVDQYTPLRYVLGVDQPEPVSEFDGIAEKIGARAVLVFEETIDIPANEVPVGSDGYPMKIRIEGDFEQLWQQVEAETRYAQGKATRAATARDLADERTDIARDMDRLAKWKTELTDALGMDRTRDWDDIRNAVAGLRKERDAKAAALERVRALDDEPAAMNAQNSDPVSYLHGYRIAISTARCATWDQLAEGADGGAKE